MSADDWGEEQPAKKRGVPSWVFWGCGGGCLLAILAVVGMLAFGGSVLREAFDPEQAWDGVAKLLPHDERPADWEAYGTSRFGIGFYVLRPPGPKAVLIVQSARDPREVDAQLTPNSPANAAWRWVLEGVRDHEAGTIELQGRTTRSLRFSGTFAGEGEDRFAATGLRIDASGSGAPTVLHVVLAATEEASIEERTRELLAPFDLWRGR